MTDLIANFASRLWVGVVNILCAPLYARLMGIESYGLVAFYVTLQMLLVTIDAGLSSAVNRDIARNSVAMENGNRMQDGVRTLEIMYWVFAVSVGCLVVLAAPYISKYWLHSEQMTVDVMNRAIILMGIAMVFQWPCGFYQNGLMGLDKQRLSNFLNALTVTVRNFGALLVLLYVSASITSFFYWQVIANVGMVIPSAVLLWKNLPKSSRPARFSKKCYLETRSFVGSMCGVSALSIVLSQLDRIVLSKFITLKELGFYNLAWIFGSSIYMLQSPVYSFVFPKLIRLMTIPDYTSLKHLYHIGCQLVSVITIPLAMLAIFFPTSVLALWTRDPEIAVNARVALMLLSLSAIPSSFAQLPFALQQASGSVKITLLTNLSAVIIAIPISIMLVSRYGMIGGAAVFVVIKIVCSIVQCVLTHTKVLPSIRSDWYYIDVGRPLVVSAITVGLFRCVWSDQDFPTILMLARVLFVLSITTSCAVLSLPATRKYLTNLINKAS